MEEDEASPLSAALHIFRRQPVVLLQDHRQVLLPDGPGLVGPRHHGLHAHLPEAQVREVQHILREVQVLAGKGAPDEVVLVAPLLREALVLGDDDVVAALSVPGGAHAVVDLFPPVQAQHYVGHLPVAELGDLVV